MLVFYPHSKMVGIIRPKHNTNLVVKYCCLDVVDGDDYTGTANYDNREVDSVMPLYNLEVCKKYLDKPH